MAEKRSGRELLASGASIAIAIAVMNVSTYAATLMAARLLGPAEYGGFAAVAGLSLVVGVLMLGLQTTGARRIASSPDHVGEIERAIIRVTHRAALGMALLCLLLTPAFNVLLNLDSLATAACVALIAWPMTITGGYAGVLQGERRWAPLALLYVAAGVARLVGTGLLFWYPDEAVAALGLAIGFAAPAAVGWLALRRSAAYRDATDSGFHGERSILREVASNSNALLAFFALSNADVILGRLVLDEHASGLYAGGLILVKSLLFLPQFVIVVAFPSMSTETARRKTLIESIAAVVALGVLGSAGGVGAQRPGADLHRRLGVCRHPGPAVGLRTPRHRALDDPAARLQRGCAPVPTLGLLRVGRPRGARAGRHPGEHRHRDADHGARHRHRPDGRPAGRQPLAARTAHGRVPGRA